MNNHLLLVGSACITMLQTSCVSHVEEELYPEMCDTVIVTYQAVVLPIIDYNCYECHGGQFPTSGISLEGHANLKVKVDDGTLVGAIRHQEGYTPMPEEAPQLDECDILKIEKWVEEGAQDN